MSYNSYYEMQLNFIGAKQRFLYHPPGVRTSKAELASVRFLPQNFRNRSIQNTSSRLIQNTTGRSITETGKTRAFEEITNLLITSTWGEVAPMLHKACTTGEVLREARFDFWDTSGSEAAAFTIQIFNARVVLPSVRFHLPNVSDRIASKEPGYKWQVFGFNVTALHAQGLLPAALTPLLRLSR